MRGYRQTMNMKKDQGTIMIAIPILKIQFPGFSHLEYSDPKKRVYRRVL
jgi:hypothetical protein